MSQLFTLPQQVRLNSSGTPYASAKAYFYRAGTLTAQDVYTTPDLSTPHSQPVQADSAGQWAPIWLDSEADYEYRVQIKTGADVLLDDFELSRGSLTQAQVGEAFYPQTTGELAASITPTHHHYPPLSVERYGADPTGADDSTAAFNRAFSVGAQTTGTMAFSATGGTFKIVGTLSPVIDKVGFDGRGCVINSSSKVSADGDLWRPTFSNPLLVARCSHVASHPLQNFVAYGPGHLQNCRFIYVTDASADLIGCSMVIRNGGSIDWQTHAEYGAGGFFTAFEDWYFDTQNIGSTNHVKIGAGSNSGERNSFTRCRFGGSGGANVVQTNGNASTMFVNCSFNYGEEGLIDLQGGSIHMTCCHLENSDDTVYWVKLSGENSTLHISNSMLAITGVKTNFAPFRVESSVTAGALIIQNLLVGATLSFVVPLVSGTGPAIVSGITTYQSGSQPLYYAPYLNRLSDGGFEAGAITKDGWTTSGGTAPTAANTNPRTGTYSLKVAGVTSEQNKAKVTFDCAPGQQLVGECYMACTGFVDGTFWGTLTYQDAAGNTLSQTAFRTVQATLAYTRTVIGSYAKAPMGTAKVELAFEFFGVTSGTPFGYVDDIVVNVA